MNCGGPKGRKLEQCCTSDETLHNLPKRQPTVGLVSLIPQLAVIRCSGFVKHAGDVHEHVREAWHLVHAAAHCVDQKEKHCANKRAPLRETQSAHIHDAIQHTLEDLNPSCDSVWKCLVLVLRVVFTVGIIMYT